MDGNRDMDPARADVASCCIENGIELDTDDLGYEIMIGYERDGSTDELPQAVADELSIGRPHTSNWPWLWDRVVGLYSHAGMDGAVPT